MVAKSRGEEEKEMIVEYYEIHWCKCGHHYIGGRHDKRRKQKEERGDVGRYQMGDIKFCCDRMREEWDDNITFGGPYGPSEQVAFKCISYGDWDDVAINYCPFCSAKIKLVNKGHKDSKW